MEEETKFLEGVGVFVVTHSHNRVTIPSITEIGLLSILFPLLGLFGLQWLMPPEWITVKQAAEILNVKPDRVRKLCRSFALVAEKFGDVWMINRKSVMAYKKTYRKPGPKPAVKIKVDKATQQALAQPRKPGDVDGDDIPF